MKTPSKLSKKSFTVVEQACHQVRGFRNLVDELDDKVRLLRKTGKMVLLKRFIPGRGLPHFHQPNSQKQ